MQARVPAQTLVDLTRQKSTGATTLDTTKLQLACDDVELGDFKTAAQQTFDATNRQHVVVAVEGVLWKLRSWMPQSPEALERDQGRWLASAERLRRVTVRDPVTPTSVQAPGVGERGDDPRIDTFDARRFRDLRLDSPAPSTLGDDDEDGA